ncbi:hypothetical protein RB213_002382, partial [Colletotrichum asianum]
LCPQGGLLLERSHSYSDPHYHLIGRPHLSLAASFKILHVRLASSQVIHSQRPVRPSTTPSQASTPVPSRSSSSRS